MNIFSYPSFTFNWLKRNFHFNPQFSSPLTIVKLSLLFFLLSVAGNKSEAEILEVGDGATSNMTFNATNRTWSPTSSAVAAYLNVESLATTINEGSVTLANNDGDISFVAAKFTYTGSDNKTLTISSSRDIQVCNNNVATGTALIYIVNATRNVTIGASGLKTNGGAFSSTGVTFSVSATELATGAGSVTLNHTGTISVSAGGIQTTGGTVDFETTQNVMISSGGVTTGTSLISGGSFHSKGVIFSAINNSVKTFGNTITIDHTGTVTLDGTQTNGGALTTNGTDMTVTAAGVSTGGGAVNFNHTGAVSISGLTTGGGNFYSTGTSMLVNAAGLWTSGGSVNFNHSGSVSLDNVITASGNFTSKGTSMTISAAGLSTNGGAVNFNHSGALSMANVSTGGGNFYSTGTTATVSSGGLSTVKSGSTSEGGSITLEHSGNVLITHGGTYTGGGIFKSTGPGSMTIEQGGLNLAGSSSAHIVQAGITIKDGGLTGTNEAAEILLHGGCNPVNFVYGTASGNIQVVGSAITFGSINPTNKLNLSAIATSDIILDYFIKTKGGNIVLHALGKIDLKTTTSTDKGILTEGGTVELKSKTTISSGNNPGITTGTGSGGALSQTANPSGSITLTGSPVVGAGNITLVTDPALTIPFGTGATEVCNGIDDDCDGLIDEGLTCSPLPVRLVLFSATKEEKSVALQWTTASETNSYRFDVERSSNGKTWSRLGSRDAANQSSQSTYYTYQDTKPLKGINLYRLKMVDYDGTFSYSRLQEVHMGKGSGITVSTYPNPSADRITLDINDWSSVKTIQLLNINGQVVGNYSTNPDNEISIKNLTSGVYFLQVISTDGSTISHKVIRE